MFSKKLEIVDPLDRPIVDEAGDDQAIKCKELRKKLENMPATHGSDVLMPLGNKIGLLLATMLHDMQVVFNSRVEHFLHQATIHK